MTLPAPMSQQYNIEWLKAKIDSNEIIRYIFFWGHANKDNTDSIGDSCFSQWFEAHFICDEVLYKTAEHWMMAQKALIFKDIAAFHKIIQCENPKEAKNIGRQVENFNELLWNEKRFEIVKQGNFHKFNQHSVLANYLIQTGDRVLVEASPQDLIWGIGLSKESKQISNPDYWRGLNLLGFALMEVRDRLNHC